MAAMGLKHMRENEVLHRDIKADNILCSEKGQVKLADLGFSVYLTAEDPD